MKEVFVAPLIMEGWSNLRNR